MNIYICYSVMDFQNYPITALKTKLQNQEEVKEVFVADKSAGNIDAWMAEKLPQSHIVIFLATERSLKAADCQKELELARNQAIGIISIKGRDIGWDTLAQVQTGLAEEVKFDGEDLVEDMEFFTKRLYDFIKRYKSEVLKMDVALFIFATVPCNEKLTHLFEANIKKPREEVSLASIHDCFSITELITYEDLGFSPEGKSGDDVDAGTFALDGDLPVNTDGGLKCFGHPVGASGIRMIYEIYKQLQGKAGPRQLKDPKIGLTHNLGGLPGRFVCSVAIFGCGE